MLDGIQMCNEHFIILKFLVIRDGYKIWILNSTAQTYININSVFVCLH